MTTRESSSSSSPVESAMDNTTVSKTKRQFNGNESNGYGGDVDVVVAADADDDTEEEEECDVEVWDSLSETFKQVQAVLDQNRMLIQRVNENHQSKIPDYLANNVALIREINGNISKVLSIYRSNSPTLCISGGDSKTATLRAQLMEPATNLR